MIEPALAVQATTMARIHARAFPLAPWSAEAIAIQLALPGYFGFIADASGMVLARTMSDEAEILTIAVAPEARRQGLGRALLAAGMVEAACRGARVLFLEVAATNIAARALYAVMGFTEIGQRPRYYADGAAALILRVSLSAPPCESAPG